MPIYQAVILGLLQGLTEFLPISSSGHLILVPWLLGWKDPGLTFDVALHLGTLLALIVYFWRDLLTYIMAALRSLQQRSIKEADTKIAWLLVVATIPGAIIGALGDNWFEEHVRQPLFIICLLIAFAGVMYVADRYGRNKGQMDQLTWWDSALIGLSQALALFPGVSRSGATISAGLWRGLTREAAARFSFLLAVPITAGAVVFKLLHLMSNGVPANDQGAFICGILVSAVTGFFAIRWMLDFVRRQPLTVFIWYRVIVGVLLLVAYFIK
jgi:undecaprenyl-diphosphatase